MCDTIPATSKRLATIEMQAAEQFDATILENRVYEAIRQADEVRQLIDVAERAYQLEGDDQYVRRTRRAAFSAAEELNEQVHFVVNAAIASECETVIEDARDGWFDDHADDDEIEGAFDEACAWLVEHDTAARDAGVDVEAVVRDEEEDAVDDQEVSADV